MNTVKRDTKGERTTKSLLNLNRGQDTRANQISGQMGKGELALDTGKAFSNATLLVTKWSGKLHTSVCGAAGFRHRMSHCASVIAVAIVSSVQDLRWCEDLMW